MTKQQMLDLLQLLSAVESWCFSNGKAIPDYLLERLAESVDVLRSEILK